MTDTNVIMGKVDRNKKLTNEELDIVHHALIKDKRGHARWKEYPCVWECTGCKFWIDKYLTPELTRPDNFIKHFKYCPRCGCKMEVIE